MRISALFNTFPLLTMLIAATLERETMTRAKRAGAALGFVEVSNGVGLALVVAGLLVVLLGGRKQQV